MITCTKRPVAGAGSAWVAGFVLAASLGGAPAVVAQTDRVLIPFDFESSFDNGQYGQMIGDMIWTKLRKQGGFILPETMQDVRDWCERTGVHPGPATSLEEMGRIVREEQAGEIGIWGKVERVAGHATDVYDIWIKVVDFGSEPPRVVYDKQARTETVSEIPHIYVAEALAALAGKPAMVAGNEADGSPSFTAGPSLVTTGFETGQSAPEGWDPLPANVTWVREQGTTNKVIRFALDEAVAGSTGVLYYSAPFAVEPGERYRFQCRWRSTGSAAKVFIKCYAEFSTGYTGAGGGTSQSQAREVYRSQQNLKGEAGAWHTHVEEFTPKHSQYPPRTGRVMLYAYWPAGVVEWDDVEVRPLLPAPAAGSR